jgi:hypothetical protein
MSPRPWLSVGPRRARCPCCDRADLPRGVRPGDRLAGARLRDTSTSRGGGRRGAFRRPRALTGSTRRTTAWSWNASRNRIRFRASNGRSGTSHRRPPHAHVRVKMHSTSLCSFRRVGGVCTSRPGPRVRGWRGREVIPGKSVRGGLRIASLPRDHRRRDAPRRRNRRPRLSSGTEVCAAGAQRAAEADPSDDLTRPLLATRMPSSSTVLHCGRSRWSADLSRGVPASLAA